MMASDADADALVMIVEEAYDWEKLKSYVGETLTLVVGESSDMLVGVKEAGLHPIVLGNKEAHVFEQITQALIEAVADELLATGASVMALYSGFEGDKVDSLSFVHLHEHLGRLTSRDLQEIETKVPLDTLKVVVDLAVEIGREGREGHPVGTLFVVGDSRKTMAQSHETVFDPVKGYKREARSIHDAKTREQIKEIAQMDGAFIIAADGTIEGCARLIDTNPVEISMSPGLGSRHMAAAAISKNTKAIAIAVSESNGTVRIFQNGMVILRIEPFRRPMKFRDFEPSKEDDE